MYETVTPRPENQCSQQHQHPGQAKGNGRTVTLQQPRCRQAGDKRAKVDGKVKPGKCARQQTLVGTAELITKVGRHTGLDTTGTQRYQTKTDSQSPTRIIQREYKMTGTIHQRQQDDSTEFTEQTV